MSKEYSYSSEEIWKSWENAQQIFEKVKLERWNNRPSEDLWGLIQNAVEDVKWNLVVRLMENLKTNINRFHYLQKNPESEEQVIEMSKLVAKIYALCPSEHKNSLQNEWQKEVNAYVLGPYTATHNFLLSTKKNKINELNMINIAIKVQCLREEAGIICYSNTKDDLIYFLEPAQGNHSKKKAISDVPKLLEYVEECYRKKVLELKELTIVKPFIQEEDQLQMSEKEKLENCISTIEELIEKIKLFRQSAPNENSFHKTLVFLTNLKDVLTTEYKWTQEKKEKVQEKTKKME